jgi:DNA-directed RNA polymerase specialized sigma24 family protein
MGRRKSSNIEHLEDIPAKEYDPGLEHPSVEQLFIREAVKHLTPKQRAVWEYWNYDRLTQDEIGEKLGISHQAVSGHIRAINDRIKKWCDYNQRVYDVIKEQMKDD